MLVRLSLIQDWYFVLYFCMCYTHTGTQPMLKTSCIFHEFDFFLKSYDGWHRCNKFQVSYESIHSNLNAGDRKSSFRG